MTRALMLYRAFIARSTPPSCCHAIFCLLLNRNLAALRQRAAVFATRTSTPAGRFARMVVEGLAGDSFSPTHAHRATAARLTHHFRRHTAPTARAPLRTPSRHSARENAPPHARRAEAWIWHFTAHPALRGVRAPRLFRPAICCWCAQARAAARLRRHLELFAYTCARAHACCYAPRGASAPITIFCRRARVCTWPQRRRPFVFTWRNNKQSYRHRASLIWRASCCARIYRGKQKLRA